MSPIEPEILLTALAHALETMAFVGVEPLESPFVCEEPLRVTLAFDGPVSGELSIIAPRALGALVAANLFSVDPSVAQPPERSADALRELVNVTAGLVFRQICKTDEMPQLQIPVVAALEGEPDASLAALSADGHPISIALECKATC